MVLLSHRAEAPPPMVARAAQSILRLAPLSREETRVLVGGLFDAVSGDSLVHLQDFVAARAGGNPLFVEEIVRSLVGKGVLVRKDDRWACTAACEAVEVPTTLHGLLLSRVDRLPAEARRLLQEAAVLGAEFVWARRLLRRLKRRSADVARTILNTLHVAPPGPRVPPATTGSQQPPPG